MNDDISGETPHNDKEQDRLETHMYILPESPGPR